MSGIVGSKFNIRGSGLVGSLGTDGQHMLSAGAGKTNVFETVAAGGGKVGQVIYATETDAQSVSSTTYADMSGMTIAITPVATSSKVMILGSAVVGNNSQYSYMQIVYGDGSALTTQAIGDDRDDRVRSYGGCIYSSHSDANTMIGTTSIILLDAPNTTSATTYKMQCRRSSGSSTIYLNRSTNDPDSATGWSAISTLIAMEILA